MRRTTLTVALLTLVGVALCAGLSTAQAPAGPRLGRRADAPRPPMRGAPASGPLDALVGVEGGNVKLVNTDEGVNLTITLDRVQAIERLQTRVEAAVARLQEIADRAQGRRGAEGQPRRDPDAQQPRRREGAPAGVGRNPLFGLLARGALDIDTQRVDGGIVLKFRSNWPEVVTALQERMPEWVAQARERGEGMRRQMRGGEATRQALRILAEDEVTVRVNQKDTGISVDISSDNPELARRIRDQLPEYFEQLKVMAQRMRQAGEQRGRQGPQEAPPPVRREGPPRGRRGELGGGRRQGGRFGPPPPPEQ